MDTVLNAIVDIVPSTADISNTIGDLIGTALNNTVGRFLYIIVSGVNWFVSLAYQLFEVFSGQIKVSYDGEYNFLTSIFFENSAISGIYWGMAVIGVVLCFAFTIIAVIRKMFDASDKMQTSLGAILGSSFKSILLILSLNVVMMAVLNFSNVLMQRVVYVFNAGASLTEEQSIDFTDDQFATMGRVLNTIGNYSLNPSYNSRYNLNSCFNEIRGDMLYLQQQGVFDFYYLTKDGSGEEVETWQSALQRLVFAANLEEELKMDVYNEGVANTLLDIMETLKTNTAFYPLKHYERSPAPLNNIPFDRVLFLACTYNAAINESFNINPSHTDVLRGPYYTGEKSIYDFAQVSQDFNLLWGFNYIVFFLIVYGILKEMLSILLDCVARIYNMIVLYLVGPPFIAISPLDGGGKMKQWMTAFIVQCFGVFGTVIAMRLLLIFAPIIIGTDLQIFPNAAMDITAKVIMIYAGTMVARKTSTMFSGILADNAGWQSVDASNIHSEHEAREREADAKKQQKKEAAVSAAKLAAGGGNLQDAKNVGKAVPQEMKDKKQSLGGGTTPNQTNIGSTLPTQTNGGGTMPEQTNVGTTMPEQINVGSTTPEQINVGSTTPDQMNIGGTMPEQMNIGSTTPDQMNIGGTMPEQMNIGSTTPIQTNTGGTMPGQTNIGGVGSIGGSIPVPPEFVPNRPIQSQQNVAPPKNPPPPTPDK